MKRKQDRSLAHQVLFRFGDDAPEGLAGAEGPALEADLAADAFQHAQAHPQLLCSRLQDTWRLSA